MEIREREGGERDRGQKECEKKLRNEELSNLYYYTKFKEA
jgi:hypothetical protein